MDFSGKVAVVTGGASGIGEGICEELVSRSCKVIVVDIAGDEAEQVAKRIGGGATAYRCDLSDMTAIEKMADDIWQAQGGVDIVYANAGVNAAAPLLAATPEEFDFIYAVNTKAMWFTCREFANKMIAGGRRGHLCMTGSEHSIGMQNVGAGLYTGSKHAILGIADVMRHELPSEITLSILCPGIVNTKIYDPKRHSDLPKDPDKLIDFSKAMIGKGIEPREVGKMAVDGVARGDFFIFTQACAKYAAQRRGDEVNAAFAAQAPHTPDSDKYLLDNVIAEVKADFRKG